MSYATFARKDSAAPATTKAASKGASTGLRIGEPDDSFEREADRVADEIMSGGTPKRQWSFSNVRVGAPLQRKCACGGSGGATGECEECKKKEMPPLQRKAVGLAEPGIAPPIVHDVLNSPGQSLDKTTRDFFGPRFGYDFSRVRVHTDMKASESARAVQSLAYTVEQEIVFGEGQYSPGTAEGHRLLAHELVHTLQGAGGTSPMQLRRQNIPVPGSPPGVGLAGPYSGLQPFPPPAPAPVTQPCLVSADCSKPIPGSSWDFSIKADQQQAQTAGEIKASPEKAKEAGVARSAVNLKQFAHKVDPNLLSGIDDVTVNPAIGESAGAQTTNCKGGAPESTGPACIEVPDELEKQAEKFNTTKDPMLGGMTRASWQAEALKTLTHEVAHAKFAKAPSAGKGVTVNTQNVANFSPDIFLAELDEINSLLSEYPIEYAAVMKSTNVPAQYKKDVISQWIDDNAIRNGDEDLQGMLKKLRCISPCSEVDNGVRKVFASQSAGWTKEQKDLFVGEVSDPKNGLNWPK